MWIKLTHILVYYKWLPWERGKLTKCVGWLCVDTSVDSLSVNSKHACRARSIQPKFRPVQPGKEDHLKRWTSFFKTFPVGLSWSIEFWTKISGNFRWMDRTLQPTVYQYNGFSGTYWWVFGLYLLGKMKYTGQYPNKIWVNMSVNDNTWSGHWPS